ncbi:xanthotoxin 5-hydroxylase CYP82C4 [Ricinus communis]|uniref:xanthotoxin 5-hydroxylase CYP82C4 n=1 Tax=Ricinus communis TaxID=3988 RepID=UPI00201B217B|nr:xanthotoxin 5-hydroxylase CYP82C4 [Ricinus communis]
MDSSLQLTAIAVIISFIFVCSTWLRGKKKSVGSKSREAPEPAGAWPIIGHLHLLGGADKLLHRTLGSLADKYGPAFNIRIGSHRALVVASKELAKECFTINDKTLASRSTTAATKHMCYDHAVFGFAPYSSHWREMRKIVMLELLSNRRLEMVKHVQASEVDLGIRKLYNLWAQNRCLPVIVELKQFFEDLTLDVIVRVVAGKRYTGSSDDDEARQYQKAISQFFHLMGIFVVSDALPFLRWLDLEGHEKAMKKTAKDLDAVLAGWLDEHRRRRVSGEVKSEGDQDFIDVMLSLEEKGHLSGFQYDADTSIKSTCLALIAGASDTTTTTLVWAISLLLNNQLALKNAKEELEKHIGTERQVDESDLKNLVYLQAVIKETLRLYPVAPLIPREFVEDCRVGGYHVPAGTRLLVNVWKIQRDPMLWTKASAFQPERFLTSHADIDVRGHHFELLPFGSGRRSCPGASFALHALHLTLARFLHAFDVATPMDQPVDMTERSGTTLPKATPLEVLLSPRLPAKLYSC